MCWGESNATTTQTSSSSIPGWVQSAGIDNFAAAKSVASRPFESYGGPRVAGFTDDMNNATVMARKAFGNWQPYFDQAQKAFSAPTTPGGMNAYMNPYLEGVLAPTLRRLSEGRDEQMKRIGAGAHAAGAYGDARHGLLDARTERDYSQQVADTTSGVYANAFDKALQTAMQQGSAYLNMGQGASQLGLNDASTLFNIGREHQSTIQRGYDAGYEDYLRRIMWPAEMLNLRIGALSGTPYPVTQTSTSTGPGANNMAQNIGAFGAAAGGAGMLWRAFQA